MQVTPQPLTLREWVSLNPQGHENPARYPMNRMAKTPSMIPKTVIAIVRFKGPKKISATMANFSMMEAVKIGTRETGT